MLGAALTFQQIVQLSDVPLHCGKESAVALGLTRAHVEFFEASRQLLAGHLSCTLFDVVWDIVLESIRYLGFVASQSGNHGDTLKVRNTHLFDVVPFEEAHIPTSATEPSGITATGLHAECISTS